MEKKSDTVVKLHEFILVGPQAASVLSPDPRARLISRIGAVVRVSRKMRGLSLMALSNESGVPKTTIHDLECGLYDVKATILAAIEKGLGVAPGWILKTAR